VVDGEALLEDAGSKNGTMLDDKPIAGKVKLHDGDRIRVGPILIVYHVSSSGMSTETVSHTVPGR
jgi:pSer/pThr/pTyr-binding forkhead associated (FHA) protein